MDFEFKIPEKGLILYVTGGNNIIFSTELKSVGEIENVYKKLYSQRHGSLPFVVTGCDEGPNIPDNIKKMPDYALPENENDEFEGIIVIDDKGKCVKSYVLYPQ